MAAGTDEEQLWKCFQALDLNSDGKIEKHELLKALQDFDAKAWPEDRVSRVLQAADSNADSAISLDEFVAWAAIDGIDQRDLTQAAVVLSEDSVDAMVRAISDHSIKSGKTSLTEALEALRTTPWEQKEPAIATLLKLMQNVVKNPDNAKFRRIKRTNKVLAEKVFSIRGCSEFLMAAGFKEEGEELVLPDGVDITEVVDELTSFSTKEYMDQKRAERDAKIAAVKAEEAASAKLKSGGLPKGGSDDEERKRILAKMEADKGERAARDKLAAEGYKVFEGIPAEKAGGDVTKFSDIGIDLNKGGG